MKPLAHKVKSDSSYKVEGLVNFPYKIRAKRSESHEYPHQCLTMAESWLSLGKCLKLDRPNGEHEHVMQLPPLIGIAQQKGHDAKINSQERTSPADRCNVENESPPLPEIIHAESLLEAPQKDQIKLRCQIMRIEEADI